jgi:hypothetical protein
MMVGTSRNDTEPGGAFRKTALGLAIFLFRFFAGLQCDERLSYRDGRKRCLIFFHISSYVFLEIFDHASEQP